METVAVIVLNYKRQNNVKNVILPSLIKNPHVSTIIIAHGLPESVFGVDHPLEDEEIVRDGKVLHIGNFSGNSEFCCWRRWKLIKKLKDDGVLNERFVHSQDDDILFDEGTISSFIRAFNERKGILLSGAPCRNITNGKYDFKQIKGPCNIAIGRSIFTEIEIICKAVEKQPSLNIPGDIIKYCDDVCLSFLSLDNILNYTLKNHFSLPCKFKDLANNDAVCSRPDWKNLRDLAVSFMIQSSNYLKN